jgi:hypothetical protein
VISCWPQRIAVWINRVVATLGPSEPIDGSIAWSRRRDHHLAANSKSALAEFRGLAAMARDRPLEFVDAFAPALTYPSA